MAKHSKTSRRGRGQRRGRRTQRRGRRTQIRGGYTGDCMGPQCRWMTSVQ